MLCGPKASGSTDLGSTELGSTELDSTELGSTELGLDERSGGGGDVREEWAVRDREPLGHAGYVRAVAAALEDAGIPVADWRADASTPREAWIPFDLTGQVRRYGRVVWDHDTAGAGWSEERGWFVLTVDDPGGRDVRVVTTLAIDVVAPPASVARAVRRHAGLHVSPEPESEGQHVATDAHSIEGALRRYAPSRTKSVDR